MTRVPGIIRPGTLYISNNIKCISLRVSSYIDNMYALGNSKCLLPCVICFMEHRPINT